MSCISVGIKKVRKKLMTLGRRVKGKQERSIKSRKMEGKNRRNILRIMKEICLDF